MFRSALALALLLLACQAAPTPGVACARTADCQSPLLCEFGYCRAQCRLNADCDAGKQCLLDHGVGTCSLDVDLGCETGVGRTCPSGLVCAADRCLRSCTTSAECPSDGSCAALSSTSGVCVGSGDAGDAGAPIDAAIDAGAPNDPIVGLCVGGSFACALRAGRVYCWGARANGVLGDGSACEAAGTRTTPALVVVEGASPAAPLEGVDTIVCGENFACAHATNGDLLCWGESTYGQIGDGESGTNCVGVATHVRTSTGPLSIPRLSGLSAAALHVCALDTSANAWCWGRALGTIPVSDPLSAVSFAQPVGGALIPSGTTFLEVTTYGACPGAVDLSFGCWGSNLENRLGAMSMTQAWTGTGNPYDAGYLQDDGISLAPSLGHLDAVAIASDASCVLVTGDHTLHCWGNDNDRQYGVDPMPLALTGCGGDCSADPILINEATGRYVDLATGGDARTICGIGHVRQIECWGRNEHGNTGTDGAAVATIDAAAHWVSDPFATPIAVGAWWAIGADTNCVTGPGDHDLWCWGAGANGVLGVVTGDDPHAHRITLP